MFGRKQITAGLACIMLLVSENAHAQSTDLTSDTQCNNNLCLQVIYSPSQRLMNYTMTASGGGSPMGWYAVGTGSRMAGSNMMIGWVNSDGSVTMSQRTAAGHDNPTTSFTAQAAIKDTVNSFSNSSGTAWSWSFPLSSSDAALSSRTSFIWAVNKSNNPSNDLNSRLRQHTDFGQLRLDLTKAYTEPTTSTNATNTGATPNPSTAAVPNSSTASSTGLSRNNKLVVVHLVFMMLGWLILSPAAVLLGRWARTSMPSWFSVHRNLQLASAVSVTIGFIVIVVKAEGGGKHFGTRHGKVGLVIFILLFVQMALGQIGHRTKRFNVSRILHVVVGLGLLALAFWNCITGLDLWRYNTKDWPTYLVAAWIALFGLAYLAGLSMLAKDVRQHKERKSGLHATLSETRLQNSYTLDQNKTGLSSIEMTTPTAADPFYNQHEQRQLEEREKAAHQQRGWV